MIFYCEKKENISHISDYGELYNGDIEQQICVSRILKENMKEGCLKPDTFLLQPI